MSNPRLMIKKRLIPILFLFIITVPAFASLINNHYFPMHDDQHIARLHLLHLGIEQGILYPRWVDMLGFGFGYPLFNFYPPLIYYIADIFVIIGFSYIAAIKLMIMAGFIIGALGMYRLSRKFINPMSSLLATTLFTYFGYRAVTVYVRGAFAEFFAMSFLPFVFLAFYNLYKKPGAKQAISFGILFALLILAHPFIAVPTIIFLGLFFVFYVVTLARHPEQSEGSPQSFSIYSFFSGFVALGLSAFYWLPSMLERKFTLTDSILLTELASYKIHFVTPFQFWWSQWGFGGSVAGTGDGMSFQLGKIYIVLTALSVVIYSLFFIKHLRDKKQFPSYFIPYTLYFGLLIFSLFMSTDYSQIIWNVLPPLHYLQFPWRFLTFTAVFIALVGGFAIEFINKFLDVFVTPHVPARQSFNGGGMRGPEFLNRWLIPGLTILIILSVQTKYFKPQSLIKTSDAERTTYDEIAWNVSKTSFEFIPKGVTLKKSELNTTIIDISQEQIPRAIYKFLTGKADVKILTNDFGRKVFQISAKEPLIFQLNTFNFPGWRAYLSPVIAISDNNPYKLITVIIPKGNYQLEFRFEDTNIRKTANVISLITLGLTALYLVSSKR